MFSLHKHCNLNQWEIAEYTLPQVEDLIKKTNQFIKFEVEMTQAPLKAMFGVSEGAAEGGSKNSALDSPDSDYQEATEEDIAQLARILGGGM
jgi:hypothetical protein